MKRLLVVLSLLTFIFSTQLFAKKFVVGIDTWTPFTYFENGKAKGITVDILRKIASKLNYEIEFKQIPWSRALKMMHTGEIDAMGNLAHSKERDTFMTFIRPPYYKHKINFYKLKKDTFEINKHEDLYKYTILVGLDYVYFPKFDNDTNINKIAISNRNYKNDKKTAEEIMLKMLFNGRVKVIIGNDGRMDYLIKKLNYEKDIEKLKYVYDKDDFAYIGISKKSPFIKDIAKINEAMKKLVNK
jgi:polar amino acid transport system substrate-binding protein